MDLMGLNTRDIMGIYNAIINQLHYDLGVSKDGVYIISIGIMIINEWMDLGIAWYFS